MTFTTLRPKEPLKYLKWWDVVVLSLIMFGRFIQDSMMAYINLDNTATAELPEFTSAVNWAAFWGQVPLLLLAFLYLWWRRFDFSSWPIKINLKSILWGILLFIGVAIIFDLYFMVAYSIFPPEEALSQFSEAVQYTTSTMHPFIEKLQSIDLSLVIYSLLNGFYEEIFFLGMCLSVESQHRKLIFFYSLIVRYAFHTYQGNISALAIGFMLGTIYYLLYTRMKEKNLFPFFWAHAISDMLGVGLLSYFLF
ncbi:type II CAAX prenyl endopeptidase Rce1 family protein [Streptococcus sp. E29BA]|uniref:CPBP family glutamic-type intramembrane protease n=1 Tax=Streptococcus sp. E29BA TaxID=3278716 RepID=UPI00359D3ECE